MGPNEEPRRHVHRCPSCYEAPTCHFCTCDLEEDLRLDDGTPCGAFVACSTCSGTDEREPLGPDDATIAGGW